MTSANRFTRKPVTTNGLDATAAAQSTRRAAVVIGSLNYSWNECSDCLHYIASNKWKAEYRTMNFKGCGSKRWWPDLEQYLDHLLSKTEEDHDKPQDIKCEVLYSSNKRAGVAQSA